ncbi:MAG TPA: hypothetical protein VMU60_01620 [Syntrophobacteria bacterium]|nr:hypothetical protein [Syntrophobacteria bacterium]
MTTAECGIRTGVCSESFDNRLVKEPRRVDRHALRRRAYLSLPALVGILLSLSNCATTQGQRAEQLGMLGKTYADAVSVAGEEATASSITFSLAEMRKERAGGAFATPQDGLEALKEQIGIIEQRQQMVQTSNQLLALLAEYFADLEQFAKQDISTSFETATGGLVDGINKVGQAVESNPQAKAKISDAERTALAKLSGLVARQVHGYALARILERDASMIGTQLKLMSKILATYSEWILARSTMELKEFYRDRVVKPFAASGELPGSWDQDVRRYLQGTSLSEQLAKAKAAGERMERFWADYLAGDIPVGQVTADLKDMERLFQEISAFNKAWADASAAKPN